MRTPPSLSREPRRKRRRRRRRRRTTRSKRVYARLPPDDRAVTPHSLLAGVPAIQNLASRAESFLKLFVCEQALLCERTPSTREKPEPFLGLSLPEPA